MYSRSTIGVVLAMVCLVFADRVTAQNAPVPDTSRIAPSLEFDFEDKAAIDVRGGAPGVLNSEMLSGAGEPLQIAP